MDYDVYGVGDMEEIETFKWGASLLFLSVLTITYGGSSAALLIWGLFIGSIIFRISFLVLRESKAQSLQNHRSNKGG